MIFFKITCDTCKCKQRVQFYYIGNKSAWIINPFILKQYSKKRKISIVTCMIWGIEQATAKPLISFCYHLFLCSALFQRIMFFTFEFDRYL